MNEELIQRIRALLRPLAPDAIFIFGSRARETEASSESDIDIAVILATDEAPASISEKLENVRRVRRALRGINKQYSIDLFVFTRREWESFRAEQPLFVSEITERGKRIA